MIRQFLLHKAVVVVLSMSSVLAAAQTPVLPGAIRFAEDGSFRLDDAVFMIRGYSRTWAPVQNSWWGGRESTVSQDGVTVRARMTIDKVAADVTETIRPVGKNRFRLEFRAEFPVPVEVKSLHGSLSFPPGRSVTVEGRTFAIPERRVRQILLSSQRAREVRIPLAGGRELKVTSPDGAFGFLIQDNRKDECAEIECRFLTVPFKGKLKAAELRLELELLEARILPVDLRGSVNAGFADEIAGDGRGGWTDQGPQQDLHTIRPGWIRSGAVAFEIIDPAQNNGNGTIVLFGSARLPGKDTVEIPLPKNEMSTVNLLHASAWTPAAGELQGEIVARYPDGSQASVPVVARQDCGNWWGPFRDRNAEVVWQEKATGGDTEIGLYASSFPLPRPGAAKLTLRMKSNGGVWMIPAVTLSDRPIRFGAVRKPEYVTRAGKEWVPLDFRRKPVRGGAFDFSFLNDAPAGKYGAVRVAPDGRLTFENAPEKRIRFYGVNLCFNASFLDDKALTELADYLAYCGYNSVRIHHHDNELLDRNASDSLTFDPAKLDRLDRLVAVMKARGIYLTTDIYCSRTLRAGDRIDGRSSIPAKVAKVLFLLDDAALENWKEFARRWMNHRNPYTGLTWGEEPAVWCVNMVNEDSIFRRIQWAGDAGIEKKCAELFHKWLAGRNLPESVPTMYNPRYQEFITELHRTCLAKQLAFLKDELHIRPLITSVNVDDEVALTLHRNMFSLVDNHIYHDHPSYLGKAFTPPVAVGQRSSIARFAEVPRRIMASRVAGKPYIVTEFNFCSPNRFRSEAGPLMGAYASLQGWDGLYRFAWAHGARAIYQKLGAFGFDIAGDPMAQAADRIAMMMFRTGNVKRSKETFVYQVSPKLFEQENGNTRPEEFSKLGLISAIASAVEGARELRPGEIPVPATEAKNPGNCADGETRRRFRKLQKEGVAESSTGEILLDSGRTLFCVNTPRIASITLSEGTAEAGALRVEAASVFQTIAAMSLDGRPLEESRSLLIFQLSDVSNSGQRSTDESKRMILDPGDRPLLLRRATARIKIQSAGPFQVTALNADGAPVGTVAGEMKGKVFLFSADNAAFPGGVLGWQLIR